MSSVDIQLGDFARLLHPFNATLISSQGRTGPPNAMAISWIMPFSVKPPLLLFSTRETKHSYQLIEETKEFVVNIPSYELAQQVLFCGRKSGKDTDKFKAVGLTAGRAKRVRVPIVNECIAHLECKLLEILEKGDHKLVIGEVVAAYVRKDAFRETQKVYDVENFRALLHLGGDFFTTTPSETVEPRL